MADGENAGAGGSSRIAEVARMAEAMTLFRASAIARRDLEIASSHDGTRTGPQGVLALAQRHNLSEIHVYRILDRQRELRRRQMQGELFGQDG